MTTKQILTIVSIVLFAAGMIWDVRIGLAGGIILAASAFVP